MSYLILFILHDLALMNDILNAWEETGVSGVTIFPSTGLARLRENGMLRDDLPLMLSVSKLLERSENTNRTFITIVKEEAMIDKVVEATQRVVGDLNQPNTGILVVLPVLRAYGLDRINPE